MRSQDKPCTSATADGAQVVKLSLTGAHIAYLSACSTAENRAERSVGAVARSPIERAAVVTKRQFSTIENSGLAFVVAVICQSGKYNPEIVREKVVGWTKAGRRYRGFMDALCAGCLILFPEQISDLV